MSTETTTRHELRSAATHSHSRSPLLPHALTHSFTSTAIHVYIVDPQPGVEIAVIGLNQYPATADAYLGLPVDVLGTDYVVATYIGLGSSYPAGVTVVATEDATAVTLTLPQNAGTRVAGS